MLDNNLQPSFKIMLLTYDIIYEIYTVKGYKISTPTIIGKFSERSVSFGSRRN